jgi:hypothetical protein
MLIFKSLNVHSFQILNVCDTEGMTISVIKIQKCKFLPSPRANNSSIQIFLAKRVRQFTIKCCGNTRCSMVSTKLPRNQTFVGSNNTISTKTQSVKSSQKHDDQVRSIYEANKLIFV